MDGILLKDLLLNSYYNEYDPSPYYKIKNNGAVIIKDFKEFATDIATTFDFTAERTNCIIVNLFLENDDVITHVLEYKKQKYKLTQLEYEFLLFALNEFTYIGRRENKIILFHINEDFSQGFEMPFTSQYTFIKDEKVYEIKYILDNIDVVSDI